MDRSSIPPIVTTSMPVNHPVEDLVIAYPVLLLAIVVWRYAGSKGEEEPLRVIRELSARVDQLCTDGMRDIHDVWLGVALERWRFSAYFPNREDPAFHRCLQLAWLAMAGGLS